jgi:CHAT domain-containing protein
VAQLKLNADWVVLSACNTAAGDGTPGAEGLSGLAKAFFYAGTRAVLVSHWPVFSKAAVKLTTTAFEAMAKDPRLGRAQALQKAMLSMTDSDSEPLLGHPMLWAPFVIVGEGGSGR